MARGREGPATVEPRNYTLVVPGLSFSFPALCLTCLSVRRPLSIASSFLYPLFDSVPSFVCFHFFVFIVLVSIIAPFYHSALLLRFVFPALSVAVAFRFA